MVVETDYTPCDCCPGGTDCPDDTPCYPGPWPATLTLTIDNSLGDGSGDGIYCCSDSPIEITATMTFSASLPYAGGGIFTPPTGPGWTSGVLPFGDCGRTVEVRMYAPRFPDRCFWEGILIFSDACYLFNGTFRAVGGSEAALQTCSPLSFFGIFCIDSGATGVPGLCDVPPPIGAAVHDPNCCNITVAQACAGDIGQCFIITMTG